MAVGSICVNYMATVVGARIGLHRGHLRHAAAAAAAVALWWPAQCR